MRGFTSYVCTYTHTCKHIQYRNNNKPQKNIETAQEVSPFQIVSSCLCRTNLSQEPSCQPRFVPVMPIEPNQQLSQSFKTKLVATLMLNYFKDKFVCALKLFLSLNKKTYLAPYLNDQTAKQISSDYYLSLTTGL